MSSAPIVAARTGSERPYNMPKVCPSCGEAIERLEGEVAYFCVNSACPAQLTRLVEHFAGVMDIVGFGEKLAVQVVAAGLVRDVADIFALTAEALLELPGFAEKKAENLLASIDAARKRSLALLLSALGIRGVGEVMAGDLAAAFGSLDALVGCQRRRLAGGRGRGAQRRPGGRGLVCAAGQPGRPGQAAPARRLAHRPGPAQGCRRPVVG